MKTELEPEVFEKIEKSNSNEYLPKDDTYKPQTTAQLDLQPPLAIEMQPPKQSVEINSEPDNQIDTSQLPRKEETVVEYSINNNDKINQNSTTKPRLRKGKRKIKSRPLLLSQLEKFKQFQEQRKAQLEAEQEHQESVIKIPQYHKTTTIQTRQEDSKNQLESSIQDQQEFQGHTNTAKDEEKNQAQQEGVRDVSNEEIVKQNTEDSKELQDQQVKSKIEQDKLNAAQIRLKALLDPSRVTGQSDSVPQKPPLFRIKKIKLPQKSYQEPDQEAKFQSNVQQKPQLTPAQIKLKAKLSPVKQLSQNVNPVKIQQQNKLSPTQIRLNQLKFKAQSSQNNGDLENQVKQSDSRSNVLLDSAQTDEISSASDKQQEQPQLKLRKLKKLKRVKVNSNQNNQENQLKSNVQKASPSSLDEVQRKRIRIQQKLQITPAQTHLKTILNDDAPNQQGKLNPALIKLIKLKQKAQSKTEDGNIKEEHKADDEENSTENIKKEVVEGVKEIQLVKLEEKVKVTDLPAKIETTIQPDLVDDQYLPDTNSVKQKQLKPGQVKLYKLIKRGQNKSTQENLDNQQLKPVTKGKVDSNKVAPIRLQQRTRSKQNETSQESQTKSDQSKSKPQSNSRSKIRSRPKVLQTQKITEAKNNETDSQDIRQSIQPQLKSKDKSIQLKLIKVQQSVQLKSDQENQETQFKEAQVQQKSTENPDKAEKVNAENQLKVSQAEEKVTPNPVKQSQFQSRTQPKTEIVATEAPIKPIFFQQRPQSKVADQENTESIDRPVQFQPRTQLKPNQVNTQTRQSAFQVQQKASINSVTSKPSQAQIKPRTNTATPKSVPTQIKTLISQTTAKSVQTQSKAAINLTTKLAQVQTTPRISQTTAKSVQVPTKAPVSLTTAKSVQSQAKVSISTTAKSAQAQTTPKLSQTTAKPVQLTTIAPIVQTTQKPAQAKTTPKISQTTAKLVQATTKAPIKNTTTSKTVQTTQKAQTNLNTVKPVQSQQKTTVKSAKAVQSRPPPTLNRGKSNYKEIYSIEISQLRANQKVQKELVKVQELYKPNRPKP